MNLNPYTFHPILGGALLPHAPQFFTRPDTEDAANIARVEKVAATIGEQLSALKPDVWITISNDHAQQLDRKSTRLNSSHIPLSRMPSSA